MRDLMSIRIEQIECIMTFYSLRDLPENSRSAIRYAIAKGFNSVEQTAAYGEITNKAVRKAINRIVNTHRSIMFTYLNEKIEPAKIHHNKKQARLEKQRKKAIIKQYIDQNRK